MLLNIKKDISSRFVIFETLAKILLRRELGHNFIFMGRYFDSLKEIENKYRIDLKKFEKLKEFINKNFRSTDLIEFKLNNLDERKVEKISFYEVKTKNHTNKKMFDMCTSSIKIYKSLQQKGFEVFFIPFIIFEDWRCSFNIMPMKLSMMREYSNYNPQRFLRKNLKKVV
jgi:hypothetical protein